MFRAIGEFAHRRRWSILIAAALLLAASIASLVRGGPLTGPTVKALEADRADRLVESIVGRNDDTTVLVLFRSKTLKPSQKAFTDEMDRVLAPLRTDARVKQVESLSDVDPRTAAMRKNEDGRTAFALVTFNAELKQALAAYPSVRGQLKSDSLEILATGRLPFLHDLNQQLEHDLMIAELVSLRLPAAAYGSLVVRGPATAGGGGGGGLQRPRLLASGPADGQLAQRQLTACRPR